MAAVFVIVPLSAECAQSSQTSGANRLSMVIHPPEGIRHTAKAYIRPIRQTVKIDLLPATVKTRKDTDKVCIGDPALGFKAVIAADDVGIRQDLQYAMQNIFVAASVKRNIMLFQPPVAWGDDDRILPIAEHGIHTDPRRCADINSFAL